MIEYKRVHKILNTFIADSFSINNWLSLQEEDRFYNWYHGYTEIKAPEYNGYGLAIFIKTSATSGVVTTQHYGEKFQKNLVEKRLTYSIHVVLESVKKNRNVTLHFKVEKVSMTGLARGSTEYLSFDNRKIGTNLTSAYRNLTPPYFMRKFKLFRERMLII